MVGVASVGCLAWVFAAFALVGCHEPGPYPTCGEGDTYTPIEGELRLDYSGFVGTIPDNWIPLFVTNETAEAVHLTGCGYDGNGDYWWADFGMSVGATTARPVAFDASDPAKAQAVAFLERCPEGDCVDKRRRSRFGWLPIDELVLDGTLTEFDSTAAQLIADVTLTNASADTLETGSLHVSANFTWRPK